MKKKLCTEFVNKTNDLLYIYVPTRYYHRCYPGPRVHLDGVRHRPRLVFGVRE